MATPITNTYTTDEASGKHSSWGTTIGKVDPVQTPVLSSLRASRATAKNHEFQRWKIRTAPATPDYKSEGEEPDRNITTTTNHRHNYTSILFRDYIVSNTVDAVDLVGRPDEMSWQRVTRSMELKQEVETALLRNVAKVNTPQPRIIGGLPAWADDGTGNAVNALVPANTPTALETAMQTLKDAGVDGRTVLMTPANKKLFSETAATGSAKDVEASMTERAGEMWAGSVSIYLTDLGPVQMVVDRYMDVTTPGGHTTGGHSFVMDDRHLAVATIAGRNFADKELAPTGDAQQRMVVWEGTLEVNAPSAIATLV